MQGIYRYVNMIYKTDICDIDVISHDGKIQNISAFKTVPFCSLKPKEVYGLSQMTHNKDILKDENENLLLDVLSIDIESDSSIINFINKYGFFFNIIKEMQKLSIEERDEIIRTNSLFIDKRIIVNTISRIQNIAFLISCYTNKDNSSENIPHIFITLFNLIFSIEYSMYFDSEHICFTLGDEKMLIDILLEEELTGSFFNDFLIMLNNGKSLEKLREGELFEFTIPKEEEETLLLCSSILIEKELNKYINNTSLFVDCRYGSIELNNRIDCLLSAIYIELCRVHDNNNTFRKCENPTCNNWFKVALTNTKKKYCCENCRLMVQKRRDREKQKVKKNQSKKDE